MKWLIRIVALLVGVIALALVALKLFIDPNDYKPQIEQQVEQLTGRNLSIGGDIGLSLVPVALELSDVELANAEGFDDPYFARIESLIIKARLLPLLRKELAVDALSLHGFSLYLQAKADGRNNWQDLSGSVTDGGEQPDAADDTGASSGGSPLAALAVNGIELVDAAVQYNDQQNGQLVQLTKLNLTTGRIQFDRPFDLDFSANAAHKQGQQQAAADVRLNAKVTLAQSLQQFILHDIELNLRANAPAVLPEAVDLKLHANSQIDLATQQAVLNDARIEVLGVPLSLQAKIENWQQALHISGRLQGNAIRPRELAQRFAIELPPMSSAQALSQVTLNTAFDLQDNRLRLQPLTLTLDDSKLDGEVSVNLNNSAVRYQLALDRINVDDYLPPPPASAEGTSVEVKTTSDSSQQDVPEQDLPIPFDMLATLNLQGRFEIASLQFAGHSIEQLRLDSRVQGGVITLDPLSLNVLEGRIRGKSVIDTRKRNLKVQQSLQAEGLQIANIANPIVAALIPDQQVDMRGTGKLYADVHSRGLRLSTLQQQLGGKAGFAFDDIVADGLDIEYLARGVITDYLQSKKLKVKPEWRGSYQPKNVTAFDVVRADFNIDKGVARTQNLLLDSKRIDVTGKGEIDIARQTLDMYTITDLTPRQLKTTAEKLLDEPLPVRVYGPWAAPQVDVDTGPMKAVLAKQAKAKVKAKTEKKIETKKQQLQDKVQDKLKDKLKNLLR